MAKKSSGQLFLLLFAVAALMAVAGLMLGVGDQDEEPPVTGMLPNLSGYNTVEGQTLTDYIGELGGGAALLTENPALAAAAFAVEQIVDCYQDVGAVQGRLYSNQESPLSAGAVAIADRNALLDPQNLFKCVAPAIPDAGAGVPEIKPCTASYTLAKDDNEFYIAYVGTTEEICRAFCAALEGCTAHP